VHSPPNHPGLEPQPPQLSTGSLQPLPDQLTEGDAIGQTTRRSYIHTSTEGDLSEPPVAGDTSRQSSATSGEYRERIVVWLKNPEERAAILGALGGIGVDGTRIEVVKDEEPELGDFNPELVRLVEDISGETHLAITAEALDRFFAANYPPDKRDEAKKACSPLFASYDNTEGIMTDHKFVMGYDKNGHPQMAVYAERLEDLIKELRRNFERGPQTGMRFMGKKRLRFLEEWVLPNLRVSAGQRTAETS
jgi:hypothetical protein